MYINKYIYTNVSLKLLYKKKVIKEILYAILTTYISYIQAQHYVHVYYACACLYVHIHMHKCSTSYIYCLFVYNILFYIDKCTYIAIKYS